MREYKVAAKLENGSWDFWIETAPNIIDALAQVSGKFPEWNLDHGGGWRIVGISEVEW